MAAVVEDSIPEQTRYRRPRNQSISPSSDPTPQISPLLQSTRSLKNKKKNFTSATFRGFGCGTSSQVSAPTVIRTSADWQAKKVRKKKQRNPQRKKNHQQTMTTTTNNSTPVVVVPDVWCAPGIAFSADSAASVDCVVSRRPVQGRGRMDAGERVNHRERSCISRRTANHEHLSILDSPSTFETSHIGSEVFGARNHRHFRHRSPGGLSEIMMFQNSLLLGGRPEGFDRYRDLRLDVDNMSYEELLELGERIGYVSTGLREDEILRCLRKTKHSILDALQSHFLTEMNWKCSICQEEYEADDEVGKLDCGHNFHISCIKQWLLQKNACPVCKVAAMAQY
ncbi:zinc finger protein [Macleaya cordata]|uniref:RING-type E3 ubiquitin transferase n=1 Tax=Macleaya cordata TaxID=56857 RepID=A0A200QUZ1_MACCD|nr:zinc finger protein [Macleaya cordata]